MTPDYKFRKGTPKVHAQKGLYVKEWTKSALILSGY